MQHNYLAFNWGLENGETISWLSPFPSFLIWSRGQDTLTIMQDEKTPSTFTIGAN